MQIITNYNPKPIPDFRWDWEATTEDFDAEIDPVGYGATEEEAIKNLKEKS